MFVAEKYPHRVQNFIKLSKNKAKKNLTPAETLARSFDTNLANRLRALNGDGAGVDGVASLSFLSAAIDALAVTISDAGPVFLASTSLSAADRGALNAALDAGAAVLDASNSLSAELDRLLRHRLIIQFALHLLANPSANNAADRARAAVAEWESTPKGAVEASAVDLTRSLLSTAAPPLRGAKATPIQRTVYAVATVAGLVAGAAIASLGGGELPRLLADPPAEIAWAEDYKKLASTIAEKLSGRGDTPVAEIEALVNTVKELTAIFSVGDDVGKPEAFKEAVKKTEKVTEKLTEGLDAMSKSVYGLFRAALGMRNTALQSFRMGPNNNKC